MLWGGCTEKTRELAGLGNRREREEKVSEEGEARRTAPRAGYVFGSSTCSADILFGLLSRVVRKDFAKESSVILADWFSRV